MKGITYNKYKSILKNKGQSLVEVIVACGILGVVTASIMSIVIASRNILYQSEDQTKATTLAQEGIEIAKHQRDIGCSFSSIKSSVDGGNNNFVIQRDKEAGSSENLIPGTINQTTSIENFTDFRRLIQIYNLNSATGDDAADVAASSFQSSGCGSADTDYDCSDKYYLIKVTVQKNEVTLAETKTIMSK